MFRAESRDPSIQQHPKISHNSPLCTSNLRAPSKRNPSAEDLLRLRLSLSLFGDTALVRCVGPIVRGTETDRLSHTIHDSLAKRAKCVLVVTDDCSIDAYGIG